MPKEIQHQQVFLAGVEAQPATDNLLVQAAHLSGPQVDDAVNCRAVPALGEQHAVRQNIVPAIVEILQNLCTIRAFAVDLGSTETALLQHFAELLGGADQREEHNGFAVPAVFLHFIGNLFEIRLQCTADVVSSVITLGHSNAANVQLQRNHLCLDRT